MDLSRILTTAGQVLQGMSDGAVINNWLSMSDDGTLDAIKAQVASSSVDDSLPVDGPGLGLGGPTGPQPGVEGRGDPCAAA
jgi:hypothetical protein